MNNSSMNYFYIPSADFCWIYNTLTIINCLQKVKVQPALLFSSFVYRFSIIELKNMKLSEFFVMKWLIEFYITVGLGIVCKRIIMKSVIKICFWKSKIGMCFGKKIKWKMVLRMHSW